MSKKITVAAVVALALAVSGYWYFSPHLALQSMRSAAEARDADAFNAHVDFPRVRESLKGQFSAMMADTLAEVGKTGGDPERAGASLGAAIGLAIADRFIDAMVRPEMMMRAMTEARLQDPSSQGNALPSGGGAPSWKVERKGMNRVVAFGAAQASAPEAERLGLVFERSGFATWKLVEVRMPSRR